MGVMFVFLLFWKFTRKLIFRAFTKQTITIIVDGCFLHSLSFFLMPLISMISRDTRHAADNFVQTSNKRGFGNCFIKLANENKSFLSHPLYIFFLLSSTFG